MFEIIRPGTKIDFVGKRHIWIGFSVLIIVASTVLFFTKGLNYGIDFAGGAEIQIKAPGLDISQVRTALEQGGVADSRITQIGEASQSEYLIKVQGEENALRQVSARVEAAITTKVPQGQFEVLRSDVVGPAAGESLRQTGFLAMFYALVSILIYVTIRFDARYSPGAVLALFHDSMIVLGILIIMKIPFDLTVLAAILALIGYSNNDTIIVFDRVRETLVNHPDMKIEEAVNRSVNETLGRSILTSLATFISAFFLWMFGGEVIHGFAFTFMIGILIGTYSSIFIAGSMVIYLTHYRDKRQKALTSRHATAAGR